MSNTKGQQKVKIGGQLRPIKFGTNATHLFCQQRGIKLSEFNELFNAEKLAKLEIDGSEIRDLIWAGLKAAALSNGEDVDFTEWTVGDWIDDLTEDEMTNIINVFSGDIEPPKKKTKAGK